MRWLLLIALLVLAAAVAWWLTAPSDPVSATAVEPNPLESDAGSVVAAPPPALSGPIDAGAMVALVDDAGAGEVDVLVEVFGARGHEAGASIDLAPPGNRSVASTLTDVMGFGHVTLAPGTYEVHGFRDLEYEPAVVTIEPGTRTLVLRLVPARPEFVVGGLVSDGMGLPLAGATVFIKREHFDDRTTTDAKGRFVVLTRQDRVVLRAQLGERRSPEQLVRAPTASAHLRVWTTFGKVRFTVRPAARPVFVQFRQLGELIELELLDESVELVPGPYELTARALSNGLLEGRVRFRVKADRDIGVEIALSPEPPIRVRVVTELGAAVGGLQVVLWATGCQAQGVTDERGEVDLLPDTLCAFDPLFVVAVGKGWALTRPQHAKLGDAPITVYVRPFDAAIDSTDAGGQLPWGGDR